MRFLSQVSAVVCGIIAIAGCAPRTLDPGSETVKVTSNASVASSCKFMGDILSENIHGDLSLSASQQERELDDINFLKNEGKKLGANTVIVIRHDQVISERQRYGKFKLGSKTPRVTYDIQGKAYSCPSGVVQSLGSGYLQHHKE